MQAATLARQTQWFDDFDTWQRQAFWADLKAHAESLAANPDPVVAKLGLRLSNGTSGAIPGTGAAAFIAIAEAADDVQALIARLKADTDTMVRTAIARELARDTTLLNKLADFLTTLGDGIDEADDQESEEEEELRQPRIGREAAYESYTRTIRAQARSATGWPKPEPPVQK